MLALGCALAIGCALGAGIALVATHGDRGAASIAAPSSEQIGPRAAKILNGTDPSQRIQELSALLATLGPEAAPALVEVFAAAPMSGGDPEFVLFAMWWARFDPQATFRWIQTDERMQYASVISGTVRSWAQTDPKQALAAARGLQFPGQREMAIDAAIAGWDESGQPGLIEAVTQLADTEQQRLAGSVARRRVATLGPAGAFRWVESFETTPEFREMTAVRVASAAAASAEGGPLAAAWATPRVRSDDRLSGYPRRIATRWVAVDPKAALAWLASLPAGADRSDGVSEAFRAWVYRDRPAAFAWIEETGLEPWNEPAWAIWAGLIAIENPQEAIELVQRFTDKEIREGTTIVIGQMWISQDRAAAEAWLAQADVSERVRKVSRMVKSDGAAKAGNAPAGAELAPES
jgi:hypothetical protein